MRGFRGKTAAPISDRALAAHEIARRALSMATRLLDQVGGLERSGAWPTVRKLILDYRQELVRRGCTPGHVGPQIRFLERLLPADRPIDEVTTELLRDALATIEAKSAAFHAYGALAAFFAWISDPADGLGLLERTPMAGLRRPKKVRCGPRRRDLSDEEILRLTDERGPIEFGRGTFYLLARTSGLRCSALARLFWRDVDLEQGCVRYRTKRGDEGKLKYLPAVTVARLAQLRERKAGKPDERVFKGGIPKCSTFDRDLERVGIPKTNARGTVNRHALKTTLASRLIENEVAPVVTQDVLDHATFQVTLDLYNRANLAKATRAAVEGAAPRAEPGPAKIA